jgi:hypothetical protein
MGTVYYTTKKLKISKILAPFRPFRIQNAGDKNARQNEYGSDDPQGEI